MASSQPLVCVFFKLPPSNQPVSRIHEIAWNVFLPQLDRLNHAFEVAQATHPSSEAKKIWLEARQSAAENMGKLQDVSFMDYNTALSFLDFLDALHSGRGVSEGYHTFTSCAREAIKRAGIAQDVTLKFREDIRIVVGRMTTIMSGDGKDVSSFITESSQSLLELATGVEECNAILEEHRNEFKEVQRQGLNEKGNPPSEEEFQVVQEKWQAFSQLSQPIAYRWEALKAQMRGQKDSGESSMTSKISTSSIISMDSSKSHSIPLWRRFFQRISSYLLL